MQTSSTKKPNVLSPSANLQEKMETSKRELSVNAKAFLVFLAILGVALLVWESFVRLGIASTLVPAPSQVVVRGVELLSNPFYNMGVNDVGIGIQLLSSLQRVVVGFAIAAIVAVPLGFLIGTSEVASKAIDPFIQILKPVSPLAWLPIGLAVLQDSQSTAIFVIFICCIWPILVNTIFGVRTIPKTYLNVAKTLETKKGMFVRKVLLPASLPNIVTGLRISLGVAWLVIIAAEMLIGGRGIGYFVWNEWNNLDISSIIVAIILIGLIGTALDRILAYVERRVSYEN
ncbi:nitrate ABC transporter permease [Halalkalibacterium ligniniphilum]|uniref:nitrate ABC transporter permease n=1 Tax=Halalkalibacterium ligniniphilum TaxID=1134413 RepID=UPI0003458127|nr:nitrate ABC transporter permease [Halalkalibacterium ligniniphilum]